MFFDEDGDLAHEFYIETKQNKQKRGMKKVVQGLRPQVSECVYNIFIHMKKKTDC